MNKKVLILYTSIGLGHKSIAENIGFYLQAAGFEVKLSDAHKVQGGFLASWGAKVHFILIRSFPFVWDWLYKTNWFISATLPFRTWVAGFNYKNIEKIINEFNPDIIISTHNTASAIISFLKEKNIYNGKFGIAFSDYHLHKFWLFKGVNFYLANIEDQKQEMVKLGISTEKIFICGITLKPKQEVNKSEIRNKLDIPSENKVVLFSSGSQAIGLDKTLLLKLAKLKNVSVVVVCGKDEQLAKHLKSQFKGTNILPFGYYSPMDELYAISDIYLSKPGGLSIAEALLWKQPVLIFYILPGGEPFNYKYLLENNLVLPKVSNLLNSIIEELGSSKFKNQLIKNHELPKLIGDGKQVVEAVKWAVNNGK